MKEVKNFENKIFFYLFIYFYHFQGNILQEIIRL